VLVLLVLSVVVLVVVGGGETGVGSEFSTDITAWMVSAKSGYCSMVMPASACANAGLLDRNASGDACFDAPAAFCGGRIVSAPASGFVRVHSLDFGFAKAALMSETRAEAFLEAMMDGFVVERRFCSSR
jgi:hypothetical protein